MPGAADKLNFAIPDGHLMVHVVPFIKGAGLGFEGYDNSALDRRPVLKPESDKAKKLLTRPDLVAAKVIRPQDMPTHVANGNFDLAISGTDWLREHKHRFPGSPLDGEPLLKMGFGRVRIVAAAHRDHGETLAEFMEAFRSGSNKRYIKIASEYVYIADKFAQENDLHPYRIIMTYGATESLVPEDCDLIVENTETGNTLRKNNLNIIHTLMESEGCLIVNKDSMKIPFKRELVEGIKTLFGDYLETV